MRRRPARETVAFRILNWYWVDETSSQATYDVLAIAFADIEATDARYIDTADIEAGNYYKEFLYGYTVSEEDVAALEEYGLTLEYVMSNHTGTQGISYDVNTGLHITGTPTQAGSVEVTVTLQVPLVIGSRFPNFYAQIRLLSPNSPAQSP